MTIVIKSGTNEGSNTGSNEFCNRRWSVYSEYSEDESNDPHRTATSPKVIRPEITTQVVKMSAIPQDPDTNVTKVQLRSLENHYSVKY